MATKVNKVSFVEGESLYFQIANSNAYYKLLVLLVIATFAFFWRLDSIPLQIYDEARLANNALEAVQDGHWFSPHYRSKVDFWNTKPPLVIALQGLCMKIFGLTELAVRIPAAIAAFFCSIFLFLFCDKSLKNGVLGLIAALILLTIPGFNGLHVARTGDYDAILCLFSLLAILYFYKSQLELKSNRYLYYAAIFTAFAVLTKSIAGLIFLPGLLIYLLSENRFMAFIKARKTWVAFCIFLLPVLAYYLLRESVSPGYLSAVWENELGGRYLSTLEGHDGGPLFYLFGWWNGRLGIWLYFIPIALLPIVGTHQKISRFLWIQVLAYLLFISISKTKLPWYDAPILPLLGLLIGLGVNTLYTQLEKALAAEGYKRFVLASLMLAIFTPAALDIIYQIKTPAIKISVQARIHYGPFLERNPDLEPLKVAYPGGNNAHVWFYTRADQKHQAIGVSSLTIGDRALICEKEAWNYLRKEGFSLEEIQNDGPCTIVELR